MSCQFSAGLQRAQDIWKSTNWICCRTNAWYRSEEINAHSYSDIKCHKYKWREYRKKDSKMSTLGSKTYYAWLNHCSSSIIMTCKHIFKNLKKQKGRCIFIFMTSYASINTKTTDKIKWWTSILFTWYRGHLASARSDLDLGMFRGQVDTLSSLSYCSSCSWTVFIVQQQKLFCGRTSAIRVCWCHGKVLKLQMCGGRMCPPASTWLSGSRVSQQNVGLQTRLIIFI